MSMFFCSVLFFNPSDIHNLENRGDVVYSSKLVRHVPKCELVCLFACLLAQWYLRVFAFHQRGPGSIWPGVISGLGLMLVLVLATGSPSGFPSGFSLRALPPSPSYTKTIISKFHIRMGIPAPQVRQSLDCHMLPLLSKVDWFHPLCLKTAPVNLTFSTVNRESISRLVRKEIKSSIGVSELRTQNS